MLLGLCTAVGLVGAVTATLGRPRVVVPVPFAFVSTAGGRLVFSGAFGGAFGGADSSTGDSGGGGMEVPSVRE